MDCSIPPSAAVWAGMVMFPVTSEGARGLGVVEIREANAGVFALLAAKMVLLPPWLLGAKAISSRRNAPPPVFTVPPGVGVAGFVTLKECKVLPPSPA